LQMTQLMAMADMGTSYFSERAFISVRSGSICSQVRFPPNLTRQRLREVTGRY
jgi:hypothetical protein